MNKSSFSVAALAVASIAASPLAAKESENETSMRQIAECGYVIYQVEREGIALEYGAETWDSIVTQVSQGTGLEARPYLEMAQAKYKRMERKMGADYAFERLKKRAQECNAQL